MHRRRQRSTRGPGRDRPAIPAGRERQAGFSLIEMSIAMVLTVMVLQVAVSSTLVINQSTHLGNKRVQLISKAEQCLKKLYYELARSSDDTDPITSEPYMAVAGEEGERAITFRRIVTFVQKAGEVLPVWSDEITFRLDGDSVVREQGGVESILLRGAAALDFQIDALGRVRTTLTVVDLTPGSAAHAVTREITINPGF